MLFFGCPDLLSLRRDPHEAPTLPCLALCCGWHAPLCRALGLMDSSVHAAIRRV